MKTLREFFDIPTCSFFAGLLLVAGGLALVSIPAAMIVPGMILAGIAVWRAK